MEKRYNKDYTENCEIIMAEPINASEEIVLAKAETKFGIMYVTWLYTSNNRYIWGHYFLNDMDAALEDYNKRIRQEMGIEA